MTCQTSFDARDNPFGPLPVVNPQHYTAHECDAARVAALLAAGANPASLSLAGWTVFHEALAAGDCDVVSIVVDAFNSKYTASYALNPARFAVLLQQTCDFVAHVSWKLSPGSPRRMLPPERHDHDRQARERVPLRHERRCDRRRPARLPARDGPLPRLEASGPLSLTRRRREDVLHQPRRADSAADPRDEAARA